MPKIGLTDLVIRALKTEQQTDFWDMKTPSFGIRVSARSKTFIIKRNNSRIALGRYPSLSLQEARKRALALKSEIHHSSSPKVSFHEAVDLFITTHCDQKNRPSTKKESERILKKRFLPVLQKKPLSQISYQQIATIIDGLLQTPTEANNSFKVARTFFRWATRRRLIEHSPIDGMQMPARTQTRERILSDSELQTVWRSVKQLGFPFGTIVQLLILTGQRRGEIGNLRREWVDDEKRIITFPASFTKNGREHTIPFGDMSEEVLQKTTDVILFPSRDNPSRIFSGWSKSKQRLDKMCGFSDWTLHDLRRTYATKLAALGIPPHITERLLNHVSGTISGVAAIYNRHAYVDEMRDAASKWELWLHQLISRDLAKTADLRVNHVGKP